MPNSFSSLYAAILDDDRAKVKELLDKDPALTKRVIEEERCESGIAHWIYSGDTVLHVAAAGYRVEIANVWPALRRSGSTFQIRDLRRRSLASRVRR